MAIIPLAPDNFEVAIAAPASISALTTSTNLLCAIAAEASMSALTISTSLL